MNYLKNILIPAIAGTMLITATSCKKLLEREPQNSPYNNVFWKDEKDAQQGIAGAYALVRKSLTVNTEYDDYMSHFALGDLTANEFSEFKQYNQDFLVKGGNGMNVADFTGDYLSNYQDWTPWFRVVVQANNILYNVPKIPDDKFNGTATATRNRLLGEALFLRAFSYFYMVRLWGDVPLVTAYEPDPAHAPVLKRSSEKMVLDTCINDLKKAITLLPWSVKDAGERAVRANRGAAFALLAHAYMWKNFRANGGDAASLNGAVAAVDSITRSGLYILLDSTRYHEVFKGKSAEGIFEINMQAGQNEQQEEAGFYYKLLKTPYVQKKTSANGIYNLDLINRLYAETDYRRKYYFDMSKDDEIILTKYCGKNAENIYYKNQANFSQAAVNANIIIFRLAEIWLLQAEAYANLGNTAAAAALIDKVRQRSGVAPYQGTPEIKQAVFEERSRELFCEGHRWYDLVRTGFLTKEEGTKFDAQRYNQEGWKMPVARKLFLNNNVMTQNKFWEGKVK